MTLVGLGLYMGYIPFNCILFERLIATFRKAGNVGFLIYIADSFGYLGSVCVIVSKSVYSNKLPWATVYSNGVMYLSIIGVAGTLMAFVILTENIKRVMLFQLKMRSRKLYPSQCKFLKNQTILLSCMG